MTDIVEWAARSEIERQIAVLDGTDMASLSPALRIGLAAFGKASRVYIEDPDARGDFEEAREFFARILSESDDDRRDGLEECVRMIEESFRTIRPDPEPQRARRPRGSVSLVRRRALIRLLADGQWRTWEEIAATFDWTGYGDDRKGPTVKALKRLSRDGLVETYPPLDLYERATDSTMWRVPT